MFTAQQPGLLESKGDQQNDKSKTIAGVDPDRLKRVEKLLKSETGFNELYSMKEFKESVAFIFRKYPQLADKMMLSLIELFEAMSDMNESIGRINYLMDQSNMSESSARIKANQLFITNLTKYTLALEKVPQEKIDDFLRVMMANLYLESIFGGYMSIEARSELIKLFDTYPKQSFEFSIVASILRGENNDDSPPFEYFVLSGQSPYDPAAMEGVKKLELECVVQFIPYVEYVPAISLWLRTMKQLEARHGADSSWVAVAALYNAYKLIEYRDDLPEIISYLQQFVSGDRHYEDLDRYTHDQYRDSFGNVKDECMHDARIIDCGLDKAIEVIVQKAKEKQRDEAIKTLFAGFHPRTGAKCPLQLITTTYATLFNEKRALLKTPLLLALGHDIEAPKNSRSR